ncbi:MAG: glycosyltransferase family 2 protein [Butyrivibrio sp.]|nr:glycosyltransferase family 2 protein [Butyrivibrio sp.]
MSEVKVSICVPTYNNPEDVSRLLESIARQTYKDYEVCISDDSTDDKIEKIIDSYKDSMTVCYVHNKERLGHIFNWNAALKLGSGEYIKIMFSDDWFTFDDSLQKLVDMLDDNPDADLAFSSSRQVVLNAESASSLEHLSDKELTGSYDRKVSSEYIDSLKNDYRYLFISNQIGAPSVTLYRRQKQLALFDPKSNWASDVFWYMEILSYNPKFVNSYEPLVSIGIHEEQYTESFGIRDERIYQDYRYMYQKYGLDASEDCRRHFTKEYLVKWNKGIKECGELNIPIGMFLSARLSEYALSIKCFISSRLGRANNHRKGN